MHLRMLSWWGHATPVDLMIGSLHVVNCLSSFGWYYTVSSLYYEQVDFIKFVDLEHQNCMRRKCDEVLGPQNRLSSAILVIPFNAFSATASYVLCEHILLTTGHPQTTMKALLMLYCATCGKAKTAFFADGGRAVSTSRPRPFVWRFLHLMLFSSSEEKWAATKLILVKNDHQLSLLETGEIMPSIQRESLFIRPGTGFVMYWGQFEVPRMPGWRPNWYAKSSRHEWKPDDPCALSISILGIWLVKEEIELLWLHFHRKN